MREHRWRLEYWQDGWDDDRWHTVWTGDGSAWAVWRRMRRYRRWARQRNVPMLHLRVTECY